MPLTQEKYLEVKDIISDIKSGKKPHDQRSYHCGTAHCIAGWLEINELERRSLSTKFVNTAKNIYAWEDFNGDQSDSSPVTMSTGLWATDYLDITLGEARSLFRTTLNIDEIEINLEQLAAHYNLVK